MNRCLFLDDWHISRRCDLELRAHPAQRYPGNPVLTKQHPWEACRLQLYGRCVIQDPEHGLYRMYYIAQPLGDYFARITVGGRELPGHSTLPAYAESEDGLRWERPALGQRSFGGNSDTNLLAFNRGQSFECGVMYDCRDPDPARRYKMFYWDQRALLLPRGTLHYENWGYDCMVKVKDETGAVLAEEPYNDWGIEVAFSPDGKQWKRHPGPVLRCYSDTGQSVLLDSACGKYVAFGRFNLTRLARGGTFNCGRAVARVESADFVHWSEPELVLCADSEDPDSFQINSMPVDLYEGMYLGLMEVDVRPQPDPMRPLQMACSRDGRHWTRVGARAPMLERAAPGAWDDGPGDGHWVRPATGLFAHDGRVRFYFSAGSAADPFAGVGLASWRRDGFVSLHAGEGGGELLTRPFVPDGSEMHLNCDASKGEVTVRIGDAQGRAVEGWGVSQPSCPVRGDQLDAVVRWPESDFHRLVGSNITLRIRMANADLYSFWTA